MKEPSFDIFRNRDLSWLSFNARVLEEAARESVPLMERIRFLSIYSSNLDEFFRVRIPALMALQKIKVNVNDAAGNSLLAEVNTQIEAQLNKFGHILQSQLLPELQSNGIRFVYNQPIPDQILTELETHFRYELLSRVQVIDPQQTPDFFPESNTLYLLLCSNDELRDPLWVQIPGYPANRFVQIRHGDLEYIVFIDDIIRQFIPAVLQRDDSWRAYSVKITRDADLDLQDEFEGNLAEKIEKQIRSRDLGMATRLLYDPALPVDKLQQLISRFRLERALVMPGGRYHNLRDLSDIRLPDRFNYPNWKSRMIEPTSKRTLLESIQEDDWMIHPPYHNYQTVLRFFNEAAVIPTVTEIWVTLYRIAADSKIATALITAARNGKKVTVFVELKARFDEANNIQWAKRMKEAGVRIIYSIPGLKVHAKIAMVKYRCDWQMKYAGILATGNFNERTARFYTDHLLFSSRPALMQELELLFHFLTHRRKPTSIREIEFKELLVAQFNLPSVFEQLIRQESILAQAGKPAGIRIKLNNLEDEHMIRLLYEASKAGVKIDLLVRGICRLRPGVCGLSENITVKRIVDRYLEHGRSFYFHNEGKPLLFAGSADWMERNLHRRIEVCFPIHSDVHKKELIELFNLQWEDNTQAECDPAQTDDNYKIIRSQEAIWKKITGHDA